MYTVYSKPNCANCTAVKSVMVMNEIEFTEKQVGVDVSIQEFTELAPGVREMPQVFKNEQRIGGLQDFRDHLISMG